jgi:hypothetical protein
MVEHLGMMATFPKVDHTKDHDKQWMSVGPDGTVLMTWTEFDKYGSDKPEHKSRILFSKSKDGGLTWDNAKAISSFEGDCLDGDQTTEGAYPVIGSDGTYHVVWTYDNKIWFNSSRDEWQNMAKRRKSPLLINLEDGHLTYRVLAEQMECL